MNADSIGIAAVAFALVAGGLFFGLGDSPASDTFEPRTRTTRPSDSDDPTVSSTVTTETGTETLPIPNVIGVDQGTAESRLSSFVVNVELSVATEAADVDVVTAQSPVAAERLPAGGTVSITVSEQPVPETEPADPLPFGESRTLVITDVEVGDCANGTVVDEELVFETVDCDEFHDVQLVARFDVEGGPDTFDSLALGDLVREECDMRSMEFVGVETYESSLGFSYVIPNEERYDAEGERTSACLLTPLSDVRINGTAEDSLW